MGSGVKQQGKQAEAALMAFLGERRRLEGDVCGKDLQRALWTDPPKVRIMPGIPRKLDYQGRMKYKKDCDEVFPQIMIGTGDCIKDLDYLLDLGVTHIINTSESEIRTDPTKYAKQGICYKGFCYHRMCLPYAEERLQCHSSLAVHEKHQRSSTKPRFPATTCTEGQRVAKGPI